MTTTTTATTTPTRDRGTASPGAPTPDGQREGRRFRVVFWVAIVLVGLLLAAVTAAVGSGSSPTDTPLDPGSATASGSKALVRVLEQRGTTVDVVRDADRVDPDGTVLVDDSAGVLSAGVARRIARSASDVVLVTTDPGVLESFRVRADPAGPVQATGPVSTAACGIPAARSARSVTPTGSGYTVRASAGTRCAPDGTGSARVWGLVRTDTATGTVTLVGTTDAFRNDTVTTAGNAALALGLLGGADHLSWYVPRAGSTDAAPSLGDLAPPWVPSAIGMAAAVAIAAGVWRGRRLGPLVVESMPVVVRASETTEGRARLYARTRDRTHALDTLRVAALRRVGRSLGLPRSAHVDEVVRRAADATGLPAARVGAVLVGGPTPDDRALVDGAAAIDDLERAVRRAVAGDAPRASRPTDPTATGTTHLTDPRPGGRP
ncbi:DUF4350 domain-containing protein [Curtobacterium sp. SL109]|uniref:DUF4350 domain-containing protein n=1 Tax=Curtobacterium sp. SL109 TaxID=2994662 RepID=UPI002274714A|nr:DUF4350 domain-containing protein [Curtobacterium sp. SL109]MCY1695833.1 DUF4350 domain-containing protein [Curtobacterium sp. SL109]